MLSASARAKATHPLTQARQRELDGLQAEMETLRREALAEGALTQPDEARLVQLTEELQRKRDAYHRAANHVLGQRRGLSGAAASARIGVLLGPRRADRPVAPGQAGVGAPGDGEESLLFKDLKRLADEVETAATRARDLEDELTVAKRESEKMQEAYNNLQAQYQEALANDGPTRDVDDPSTQQEMQTLQGEKQKLENQLAEAQQRINELENSLEQTRAAIQALQTPQDNDDTQQLKNVSDQLAQQKRANEKLKTSLNEAREKLANAKAITSGTSPPPGFHVTRVSVSLRGFSSAFYMYLNVLMSNTY